MDINIVKKTIFYTLDTKKVLKEKKRRTRRKIAITRRQKEEKQIQIERIDKLIKNADAISSYFLEILEKKDIDK